MKKILVILSSVILISSPVFAFALCAPTPARHPDIDTTSGGNDDNNGGTSGDYEKNRIIKRLTSFSELLPLVVDSNEYQTVNSDDAFSILKSKFKEFSDDLMLTQTNFTPIEIAEDGTTHYGQLTVVADYKDKELTNPKTNDSNFLIHVATNNLKWANDTVQKLNESITMILSKINLSFQGANLAIGNILSLITSFHLFDSFPKVIPTSFNADDQNWKQWQGFVNELMNLPVADEMLKNGEINETIKKDLVLGTTLEIKIIAKYLNILNSLAPDIIHFRNFVLEKREQQKSQNLILLLLQYLFEEPREINNDGFLDVNQNIPSTKNKKRTLQFSTNLEHILHNLLEGWKSKSGEWSDSRTPISIVVKVDWLFSNTTVNIKYEKIPPGFFQITSGTEGLIDILSIDKIKAFINQIFNYDLTTDLSIKVKLVRWDFNFPIPSLSGEIKKLIPSILKISGHSSEAIDNTSIELVSGVVQIEYQDEKDGVWKTAAEITDLKSALEMRININNIKFKVKSNNDTMILLETTNPDLHLISILDINSKILGK
ncbi:hypothetical protein [Spiroplasma citri]|uniref:Lipoprotein n=2 Tax=Spiroplasma citri TaxID=2133 RepID=A0AAJ4JYZ8_SPICI|nr:hypothetical protein [Spiroplasma citri]APE75583.1 putative lipoprotein [Spiroplasma citri]QIA67781.1 hypothetical protein GMI18_09475 [Spiroplasma citri]QIA69613.1 hypothetical protein GL298_09315 [Spiroplasma citri]QIA71505.1 hypothetical protein GL981_09505 [Spiroplasma citri]QIA73614.1 hypothetical protein GL982_08635 [Spiroplasma citri]